MCQSEEKGVTSHWREWRCLEGFPLEEQGIDRSQAHVCNTFAGALFDNLWECTASLPGSSNNNILQIDTAIAFAASDAIGLEQADDNVLRGYCHCPAAGAGGRLSPDLQGEQAGDGQCVLHAR